MAQGLVDGVQCGEHVLQQAGTAARALHVNAWTMRKRIAAAWHWQVDSTQVMASFHKRHQQTPC